MCSTYCVVGGSSSLNLYTERETCLNIQQGKLVKSSLLKETATMTTAHHGALNLEPCHYHNTLTTEFEEPARHELFQEIERQL